MSESKYYPALDGLRAIAVIAVIVFHFWQGLLPGGFVGVDVFFVLSGFLISSIIFKELELRNFHFTYFYQRRIARILPASVAVLLATLLAASLIYSSQDFASTGAMAVAATLFLANIKLLSQGDYFDNSVDAQPLLHFWTLSLEEQFYFFYPLLLVLVWKFSKSKKQVLLTIGILSAVSYVACILMSLYSPKWAFYMLPTRAWELLAGGILALTSLKSTRRDVYLSYLGMLLIVLSFFLINEKSLFPGYISILPVVGTLCCIYAETRNHSLAFLSNRLLVYIGKISYSLYLWHWPLHCFIDYHLFLEAPLVRTLLKVLFTIALSILSYNLIEKPARLCLRRSDKLKASFLVLFISVIILSIAGYSIRRTNFQNVTADMLDGGGIVINSDIQSPRIALVGDSYASMFWETFNTVVLDLDVRGYNLGIVAGNPVAKTKLFARLLNSLEEIDPDIIILSVSFSDRLGANIPLLRKTIDAYLTHSKRLLVVQETPVLTEEASRRYIRKHGVKPVFEKTRLKRNRSKISKFFKEHPDPRILLMDTEDLLLKKNGEIKIFGPGYLQLWQDHNHLSLAGADLFKDRMQRLLQELLIDIKKSKN